MQSSFVQLDTQIWKEGDMYVAHIPLLQLSSCGYTVEEAQKNIKEVTEIFFEETERKGTTKEVLEELGFTYDQEWEPPEIVKHEKMSVAI
ncbi:MAG: type II toxin-antitoxin system HicB family antitoxin [bacterium]|nr:type II toxin-antitoxin system HicB family antitoxin [bacterium]